MSLLHFSSPEKWKTHLLFSHFAGKRISNVQTVPWEKRSWHNLYWRGDSSSTDMVFYSGPAFKHLPLHFEFVHTHVLLLKWGFSRTKYAKLLFLAGSTTLVIPVNSQLDLPDRHNRQFSFPNPRNVSVVQTVAESLVLKTNWFAKQSRQKKEITKPKMTKTLQIMHWAVFETTCLCRISTARGEEYKPFLF